MSLIDLHSHWGTEEMYPLRGKAQQDKQVAIWKTECRFWTKREMTDYFRQNDVKTILDIGFTRELPLDQVRRMHDEMIELQQTNSDVILGNWLQLNPDTGDEGLRELERVRGANAGFVGLAISAVGNRRLITDASFTPYYEYCSANKIPVMVFVGYTGVGAGLPGGHGIILELGHPRYVDEIAAHYPNLKIIAGRSAWPWQSEMIAVMLHKPNVWAEYHGVSPKRLTAELKEEIGTRLKSRVMFAADYPMLRYEKLVGDWKGCGYSDDILEGVFHKNAERFLAQLA